jgi:hypothetical protein
MRSKAALEAHAAVHIIRTFTPSIFNRWARTFRFRADNASHDCSQHRSYLTPASTTLAMPKADSRLHCGRTQQDRGNLLEKNANDSTRWQSGQRRRSSVLNALERCKCCLGEDKLACEARVIGYGSPQDGG